MTARIITQMCDVCDETKRELENIQHLHQAMTDDQVVAFFRGLQLLEEPQNFLRGSRTARIITQMCDACDETKRELENIQHLYQAMTDDQLHQAMTDDQRVTYFKGSQLLARHPDPSVLAFLLKLL